MIQTDLYSFSYKTGTFVPWCKKCGAENFYKDGKICKENNFTNAKPVILGLFGAVIYQTGNFSAI